MKEDWLHKVHDRMSDYEIDVPENLWDALESKRAETPSTPRLMKRPVMIWVKRSIAVAAMIAVIIAAGLYFINIDQNLSEPQLLSDAAHKNVNVPVNKPHINRESPAAPKLSAIDKPSTEKLIAQNRIKPLPQSNESEILPDESGTGSVISGNNPTDVSDNQAVAESNSDKTGDTPAERRPHEKETLPSISQNNYFASIQPQPSPSNNISVSIYSTGGTGSALNYNSKGDSFISIGPNDSNWEDNPMLGILVFNQGKDIETDIKHRLPIKAGVSFAYNFNDRFGIETGLSYTNLISDIKEGSESHYYTGEQKLHYIGIPLNLKYRMLSWNRFDLYASAGALAEKCVSAKLDKEYILDHQKKGLESEKLSEKPLQWSVNASVGIQCNLVNSMSIFVEPGISYYFNDGTDIKTIYKEKPLNFNLNIGIRFTFGK